MHLVLYFWFVRKYIAFKCVKIYFSNQWRVRWLERYSSWLDAISGNLSSKFDSFLLHVLNLVNLVWMPYYLKNSYFYTTVIITSLISLPVDFTKFKVFPEMFQSPMFRIENLPILRPQYPKTDFSVFSGLFECSWCRPRNERYARSGGINEFDCSSFVSCWWTNWASQWSLRFIFILVIFSSIFLFAQYGGTFINGHLHTADNSLSQATLVLQVPVIWMSHYIFV